MIDRERLVVLGMKKRSKVEGERSLRHKILTRSPQDSSVVFYGAAKITGKGFSTVQRVKAVLKNRRADFSAC